MVSLCPDAVHFVNRAISAGWRAAWIVTPAGDFTLTPYRVRGRRFCSILRGSPQPHSSSFRGLSGRTGYSASSEPICRQSSTNSRRTSGSHLRSAFINSSILLFAALGRSLSYTPRRTSRSTRDPHVRFLVSPLHRRRRSADSVTFTHTTSTPRLVSWSSFRCFSGLGGLVTITSMMRTGSRLSLYKIKSGTMPPTWSHSPGITTS